MGALDSERVEAAFCVTYQLFELDDVKALRAIKKMMMEARGKMAPVPTPKNPALDASVGWYIPTVGTSEDNSE